jgi:quinol monooxygenase YgiN
MIVIAATLTTLEGKGDEVEQEFKKLVPIILKDPGTLGYAVHRAVKDPNKFLVYEQYENQEALQAHGQMPHFKAFNQTTRGMFAGRAEITMYNKIA